MDITNNLKQTFWLNSTDLKNSSVLSLYRHHEIHVSLLDEAFHMALSRPSSLQQQGFRRYNGT
jgi:hypothetical protein